MADKKFQLEKFREIYQQLNEQQRLAVDTIEGPVMVIAGPGTGKTQILSARIGKILLETDALPRNILCLTYTDAGVVAMRKRLLNFIGADAYKVNICTFHSFCNDVIQENLSYFEKTALDPISDLEKIELFKELIDSFPSNHPLKRYRGDAYFEINNLQSLFSTMKREGWTHSFVDRMIDEYIASLEARDEYIAKRAVKDFKKGEVRTDKIEEEKEKMEKLRAAVNEFESFQQMMNKRRLYDFDDMINWVLKAFEKNNNLLLRYQEQFLYILVDEYQDTSGTQNKLVEMLINFWEKPNVFVVGDDDQSIYRFQGANVENMLNFANNYKNDLLTIILTQNYRSTQPILDLSKMLIDKNNDRLVKQLPGLSKELQSSNVNLDGLLNRPLIKEYETQRQEMIDIVLQTERLIQQGTEPGRIGVIYKENKYGIEIAKYFKLKNIPYYSKRTLNLLEIPLAKRILLVLEYLATEHDIPFSGDEMLFEILHFDWFNIPAIEIAKLSVEVSDRQFGPTKTSLRALIHEKANNRAPDLFSQPANPNLKKAGDMIEKLIKNVSNVTLQVLFENVVRECGAINSIMQSPEKPAHMQALTVLFDFIKEATHRNSDLDLQALVNMINLMKREGLSLPLMEVSGSEKGVNLLTAHGAKGLEFEHVFFMGCNAAFWEKKRNPSNGYSFPDTIFSGSRSGDGDIEELRRLFYVAITRAEKHLTISYSRFTNEGRQYEPSMFVIEAGGELNLSIEKVFIDASVLSEFQVLEILEQAPEIEKMEESFVSRLLEKFVMNVTALNNYLKCPLQFYYQNLVRIPSPKNEATEFGSAVHYALEQLFKKMQADQKFAQVESFISDFEWYMRRHRESFTKEQFNRRLGYGQMVLKDYYNKYINSWSKIISAERNIRNVVVNGVPLKGKLDKLEFDGKLVNVVDYKTGDPEKARSKLMPPIEKEPKGGDYWRQAVFYKILVDNYESKQWKVTSTEFDFIEPDKKKNFQKYKLVISDADTTTVNEQIITVWNKIMNHDFYTGCGKEDCHWCNFVKTNNLTVALHTLEEEPEESL